MPPRAGSSPRVRGLHETSSPQVSAHGIIPARAGFTGRRPWRRSWPADHPRACGVYATTPHCSPRRSGSSPRVRGLRHQPAARHRHRGIIPARAGFTSPTTSSQVRRRDHPRACGVYARGRMAVAAGLGSSPRVRGLQVIASLTADKLGIIPARAGFTCTVPSPTGTSRDHPRACGVYAAAAASSSEADGSSPRVRGLLSQVGDRHLIIRIIPARAGFTGHDSPRWRSGPDHPRTRGVYALRQRLAGAQGGSSPHARGLLDRHPIRTAVAVDHPRTRGVYVGGHHIAGDKTGSSPHARGLRGASPLGGAFSRIIPARAGFTRNDIYERFGKPDHPRTRGVY